MKHIQAVIRPHMLTKVISVLKALPHFPGVTVSDAKGFGRGKGEGGKFDSNEASIFFDDVNILHLFCSDSDCDQVVTAIKNAARTGKAGDGIVVVAKLTQAFRIATSEEGDAAL